MNYEEFVYDKTFPNILNPNQKIIYLAGSGGVANKNQEQV